MRSLFASLFTAFIMVLCALITFYMPVAVFASGPLVIIDQYHFIQLSTDSSDVWKMVSLAQELTDNGYAVQSLQVPVTDAALAECAVFIVTAPAISYSDAELLALQAFVQSGGGVLLAADYGVSLTTGNPTSWAQPCKKIANAFGFTLDNNAVSDPDHNIYDYPYWITFGTGAMGSHPIMQNVNTVQFFGATTLSGPDGSENLISTYPSATPASRAAATSAAIGSGCVVVTGNSLFMADVVAGRNVNGQLVDMTGIQCADNRRFAYQVITHLAGSRGRPLVSVSSPASGDTLYGTVTISGTVCDADLLDYRVEFAPASNPSDSLIIAYEAQSKVMQPLAVWDVSSIPAGDYLLRVVARKSGGVQHSCELPVTVEPLEQPATIADCKSYADGTLVKLSGKVASSASGDFEGHFYVQEPDRSSGIRVISQASGIKVGDNVSMVGRLGSLSGERTITSLEVVVE